MSHSWEPEDEDHEDEQRQQRDVVDDVRGALDDQVHAAALVARDAAPGRCRWRCSRRPPTRPMSSATGSPNSSPSARSRPCASVPSEAVDRAADDEPHLRERVGRVGHRDAHLDPVVAAQRREAARAVGHAEQRRLRAPARSAASHGHAVRLGAALGDRPPPRSARRSAAPAAGVVRVAHVRRLPRPAAGPRTTSR